MRTGLRARQQLAGNPRIINPEAPCEAIHDDVPPLPARPLVELDRDANHGFADILLALLAGLIVAAAAMTIFVFLALYPVRQAHARDLDGRYAKEDPTLHAWFDQLKSGKGLCCSFADGVSIKDVDWSAQDRGGRCVRLDDEAGHYCVRLNGVWYLVPDKAVITGPNKFGPAVVWPLFAPGADGKTQKLTGVRCFLPGAGA